MKKENSRIRLMLRLPNGLYQLLRQEAHALGVSMNALVIHKLTTVSVETKPDIMEQEIKKINAKLDEIKMQRQEVEFSREVLLTKASSEYQRNEPLEKRVLSVISNIGQSELAIADAVNENVDVVFYVLSYLTKSGKIKHAGGKFFK